MLIRDKVPPRFRSHFCFMSRFLLGGVILLRRKSRFRPYLENGTVTILWLGSSSRAGLAPAACRFIEKLGARLQGPRLRFGGGYGVRSQLRIRFEGGSRQIGFTDTFLPPVCR